MGTDEGGPRGPASLPWRGTVVWLTRDQGGRASGPPGGDYAANGFLPPLTATTGLASLVVRVDEVGTWRSSASAGWLVPEAYPHQVSPGDVVVVIEGPRIVGYLHVEEVGG